MNKIFLDTSFAIAGASKKDAMHQRAKRLAQQINTDRNPLFTTQAVLLEIGNALSKSKHRRLCIDLLENFENDPNTTIISITDELYDNAFELFKNRSDKEWGLVIVFRSS